MVQLPDHYFREEGVIGDGAETEPFGFRQKVSGRLSFNGDDFGVDFLLGRLWFAIGVGQQVSGTNGPTRILGPLGLGTESGGRQIRIVPVPDLDRVSGASDNVSGHLEHGELL